MTTANNDRPFRLWSRSRVSPTPGWIDGDQWGTVNGLAFTTREEGDEVAADYRAKYPKAEFLVGPAAA